MTISPVGAKGIKLKLKRDVAIPLALMREIAEDLLANHARMRVNAIRARLGIVEACMDDVLDAYEGVEEVDEYN